MCSTAKSLPLTLVALACLVARPVDAQTIYAAVWGDPRYVVGSSTLNSGLYRSTDLGATWTHLGPRNLKAFSIDAVDAERGRVLYIAAGNGVHRSLDSGRTWRTVTDWRMTEVLDVDVDQGDPRRIYASTAHGLWVSDDGGDTWTNPAGPLQQAFVREIQTRDSSIIAWADDRRIEFPQMVWTSSDRGRRWELTGRYDDQPLRVDSFSVPRMRLLHVDSLRLAATWGGGVYRNDGDGWKPSGLEGRQVWRVVAKEY